MYTVRLMLEKLSDEKWEKLIEFCFDHLITICGGGKFAADNEEVLKKLVRRFGGH